ncbi:MAG: ATP-binding cassette domain-containing protein, partial [Chloroflexota bacterium]|nr:ATP-binding cassette domain-containing protein [Chloroflexota bacterium]
MFRKKRVEHDLVAADHPAVEIPGMGGSGVATIELQKVSKWYGDIVAVSDVSFGIGPGVTGLLGPNGAGKSTALKMMAGLQAPSSGSVRIDGHSPRGNSATYRNMGLVSEHEVIYPFLTGREFVRLNAKLQRLPQIDQAVQRAIDLVDMEAAAERK